MQTEIFIILVLTHFVSDWFFQPTFWALTKQKNWKTRLFHSIQYAIIFLPVFYFLKINFLWSLYLLITHFIIDSYVLVNLWNKYIRNSINRKAIPKDNPLYMQIVEDQIIHILLLSPIAI